MGQRRFWVLLQGLPTDSRWVSMYVMRDVDPEAGVQPRTTARRTIETDPVKAAAKWDSMFAGMRK